jgi:hypothetical protein
MYKKQAFQSKFKQKSGKQSPMKNLDLPGRLNLDKIDENKDMFLTG